jgi:hypothetical protein
MFFFGKKNQFGGKKMGGHSDLDLDLDLDCPTDFALISRVFIKWSCHFI